MLRIVNEVNVTVRSETFRILRCVKMLRMRISESCRFPIFYMVRLPFIITVQGDVTHAHIGKLWVFDFCMIRLPFIVTVQENVTRVHIGKLYVFLFLYDKVIFLLLRSEGMLRMRIFRVFVSYVYLCMFVSYVLFLCFLCL